MRKKISFALLGLLVSLSSIHAQYTLTDDDVIVTDGVITLCSYNFAQTDITIPSSLDGQTVSGIGNSVFEGRGITSVGLPGSIQTIGERAFRSNTLTSLNLSTCADLQSIGGNAFALNAISNLDVSACTALQTIGEYAFHGNNISNLDLSACTSLQSIEMHAFEENNISNLDISTCSTLHTIAAFAFRNNSIASIDLSSCTSLQAIGFYAFRYNSLSSIDLSPCTKLEYIGEAAFYDNLLSGLSLPTPMNAGFIFEHWKDASGNTYPGNSTVTDLITPYYAIQLYTLTDDDVVVTAGVITSCSYDFVHTDIHIPSTLDGQTIIGIGDNVFLNKGITYVRLPGSLQTIGEFALGYNFIPSIDLSSCTDLQIIGYRAFNSNSIQDLDLSSCTALQSIGELAFYGNDLSSFTLPTPAISGYVFQFWEDGDGDSHPGNSTVTDFRTSYAAILVIPALPTLSTQAVSNISGTSATGNGMITNLGAPDPIQHGLCWNTSGTPDISDNFSEEGAVSSAGAFSSELTGLLECTSYYIRAYATNSEGTAYGAEVSFTTNDETAPAPDVAILPDLTGECELGSLTAPTATDNCAGSLNGTHDAALPITTPGTTVVTWTFDDGNGNTASQTQNVLIDDVTNPVPDVTNLPEVNGECEIASLAAPTATDNCAGSLSGTHDATLPITTPGTTVVTWTYDDGNGNTASQTQNVIIDDVTNPVPDLANLPDVSGECEIASLASPTATDNCAGSLTGTHDATLPITTPGTTVVTWTFDDGNGNTASQTQNVLIDDVTNPVPDLVNLPDVSDECEIASLAAPTATDNCAGSLTGTHNATLPLSTQGTTVVTWTYDDGNGNSVTQTQNVHIEDVTNPTITCVGNQEITIEQNESAYFVNGLEFDPIASDDNCSTTSVFNNLNSAASLAGTEFLLGTTSVTWTVSDEAGNNATCTFEVVINQNTGINDPNANAAFKIYPNPAGNYITIISENVQLSQTIEIIDITGTVVKLIKPATSKSEYTIQIADLQKRSVLVKSKYANNKICKTISYSMDEIISSSIDLL